MVTEKFIPTSAKFKFELMLFDSAKENEQSTALLSEVTYYAENTHQDLGKVSHRAFDINRNELVDRLVKKLGSLLHALATGLIAKRHAKGYDPNVEVVDLLCLHPDEVTAPIKNTPFLFLKHYREL